MANRVLVPLDGSQLSESVVALVADITRTVGAIVRVLRAVPLPDSVATREGHAAAETTGRREADVLVVAIRTCSSLRRAFLGSVAEEVLRQAPTTIVLVRPR